MLGMCPSLSAESVCMISQYVNNGFLTHLEIRFILVHKMVLRILAAIPKIGFLYSLTFIPVSTSKKLLGLY